MTGNRAWSVAFLTAVLLAGCGGSEETSPETETEEVIEQEINNEAQPPEQESIENYYDVALLEAQKYVEAKEAGTLSQEALTSYVKVIRQQADKVMDEERKAQLQQLASRIEENDVEGVKQLMEAMQES